MSAATASPRRKHVSKASPRKRSGGPWRATKREAREHYGPLGRPVWSGSISFGLVNIPVRLHTAVREQRIAFHMLHDQDKARLRRRLVCPVEGKEVHPEHIVRGFEVEKDRYVVVRDEDLEACAPEKTKAIEITDFVKLGEIDPIYFDRPYYVLPQAGSSKPYRLLVEAMTRAKRVGLARLVMSEKEHLAALRPLDGLLCLETMHFSEEIVPLSEIEDIADTPAIKIGERELKAASQLIRELTDEFDPKDYRDEYRECIRNVIEKMAHGENVVDAEDAEQEQKEQRKPARSAANLMAALEASLAEARGKSSNGSAKRRKGQ